METIPATCLGNCTIPNHRKCNMTLKMDQALSQEYVTCLEAVVSALLCFLSLRHGGCHRRLRRLVLFWRPLGWKLHMDPAGVSGPWQASSNVELAPASLAFSTYRPELALSSPLRRRSSPMSTAKARRSSTSPMPALQRHLPLTFGATGLRTMAPIMSTPFKAMTLGRKLLPWMSQQLR